MNVSDTCNAAADLIEVRGWTSGGDGWDKAREGGPLCVEGALMAVTGHTMRIRLAADCPAYRAVEQYVEARALWLWNDHLGYDFLSDNPYGRLDPRCRDWARERVVATLRAVAVIHAAQDASAETRAVEVVPA